MDEEPFRGWEYSRKGDYHRNLDLNWSYAPTYLQKIRLISQRVCTFPRQWKLVDLGCGEGVLVEQLRREGWDIRGLDLNYESELVERGSILDLPYQDHSIDAVFMLDTLEHLSYEDQPTALKEIHRVLAPGGRLLVSVPNLAHLNSRLSFAARGQLDRPDIETNHIGERPMAEYLRLLREARFRVRSQIGITLTVPFVYRQVICRSPARFRWLHNLLEPLARLLPSLSLVVLFDCSVFNE